MSYKLRRRWEDNPKAAGKDSIICIISIAFMILIALSDGFSNCPPIYQILIWAGITLCTIGGVLYLVRYKQRTKGEEKEKHKTC